MVVLGGSGAVTPALVEALVARVGPRPDPARSGLELVLHGRDAAKLALVEAACRARAEQHPWLRVSATTSREAALDGAALILNQVRVGGLRARAFDEAFPRALGLPGEETLGPGGFSNAYRTLSALRDLFPEIARRAPQAVTVNLTNPASMVQQLAQRTSAARVVSVCDSPLTLIERLRSLAAAPASEADYLGMNHCGWVVALRDGERDHLPALLARPEELGFLGIDPALVAELGIIPGPYLRYYYHPDRMLAAQQGQPTRAEALLALESELLGGYAGTAEAPASVGARRGAVWYALAVVPMLEALLDSTPRRLIANVRNGALLPYLPPETVVELAAEVSRDAIRPLPPPALPPDARGLLAAHAAYESLAVQGILEGSPALLHRALLANPMVPSSDLARRALEAVVAAEVNRP